MTTTTETRKTGRSPVKGNAQKRSDSPTQAERRAVKARLPKMVAVLPAGQPVERRREMIAEAAYFHAERRGFMAGGEMRDWLTAETEIDRLLGYYP